MFENIGGKMKTLATVTTVLGITVSVIWGFVVLTAGSISGLLIMIIGSLVSWIGSFMTYGIGELIDNTRELVDIGKSLKGGSLNQPTQAPVPVSMQREQPAPVQAVHAWRCPNCGNLISQTPCPHCQWQGQARQTTQYNRPQDPNPADYHCGKCGTRGPFGGNCPNCGSSIKVYEY